MPTPRRRWSTEKTRPSVFWLLAAIILPWTWVFTRIEITGRENLPMKGAYVLAPNHYSELDPLIVAVAVWKMGRAPRFLAKESLFRAPVLGWALKATGMVPVPRASSAAAAKNTLKTAEHLAEKGHGLIVYPEGTLTRDPDLWPMRGKSGAVRLAVAGDLPLIPMAQWGTQQILPRYGKRVSLWPLRKRMQFRVGAPIDLTDMNVDTGNAGDIAKATDTLMAAIAAELGEIRGEKPPPTRWDPGAHGQAETGRI